MVLFVHRLPVPVFAILPSTKTNAVVFAFQLVENVLQLYFEVYFVFVLLYHNIRFLFTSGISFHLALAKPIGNLQGYNNCSCSTKTHTCCVFIIGISWTISMTFVLLGPLPVAVSYWAVTVGLKE